MSESAPRPPLQYRMCGLNVASEVVLPMRTPLDPHTGRSPDVIIGLGEVPQRIENARHQAVLWSADETRFLLALPGIGGFMAEEGRRLTLQPAPGVAVDDILVFATGTALAAILYQRGALLLHASVVVHEGRAFAFCGASGAGKSTLAGALCRAGCRLLADDLCAVEQAEGGTPTVQPDGRVLRLYPDSIEQVGLQRAVGTKVRQQVEKFHVTAPASDADGDAGVPLAAVYVLADANSAYPPGITRLSPLDGAHVLLRQSYRRRLALAYARQGRPPARMAALLSHAPVYRLHRPRDFAKLDDTVARLMAHWDAPI